MGYGGCTICNKGSPLLGEETREFTQRQRRRVRKRHLKSEFVLPQTSDRAYSISFNSSNVGKLF